MAVRPVLELPDPRLKQVCAPWSGDQVQTDALVTDMLDTLRSFKGCVGLAAPQIGEMWRAIVVDVTGHKKAKSCHGLIVMFNPEILAADGAEVAREGCLSLPDFTANVNRATHIVVTGQIAVTSKAHRENRAMAAPSAPARAGCCSTRAHWR